MNWITLISAGVMEVLMVMALKRTQAFQNKQWTTIWFLFSLTSLYLLSIAIKTIPLGTAYGVWTGIGAMGSVVIGMLVYKEEVNWMKLLLIGCIIISIIGLKMV